MNAPQARGYVFENIIWDLLQGAGYIDVKTDILEGRGASHQIDAYGTLEIPTAFTYPIRLIAEAKCYNKTVELDVIRNFFGVVQDISENYIVGENKERNTPYRYLDAGCIFSASPFSDQAQNYAWAHNIFLVSFSGISKMNQISESISKFISEIGREGLKNITKKDLIEKYEISKETNMRQKIDIKPPTLVVGIIDNIYPVILVGDHEWIKRVKLPEDTDKISGEKIERKDRRNEAIFNLSLNGQRVCFNLPNAIAQKLIKRIEKTGNGEKIFELDIPLKHKTVTGNTIRRILKVDVNLPDKQEYCRKIFSSEKSKHEILSRWETLEF